MRMHVLHAGKLGFPNEVGETIRNHSATPPPPLPPYGAGEGNKGLLTLGKTPKE
jgi:hypothetical protein